MNELSYSDATPAVDEYLELRAKAGLSAYAPDAAAKGLSGTCFAVCVRDNAQLIGMGRVIGDGGCFFQIVDMAVDPGYQRRGIGFEIMTRLMQALRQNAPKSAYVSLIADGPASQLYERFGFEITAPASAGMALRL
jgi:ribosomal protein S18 acetylase RimI-like enzyme